MISVAEYYSVQAVVFRCRYLYKGPWRIERIRVHHDFRLVYVMTAVGY